MIVDRPRPLWLAIWQAAKRKGYSIFSNRKEGSIYFRYPDKRRILLAKKTDKWYYSNDEAILDEIEIFLAEDILAKAFN